jgi:hypothetical protein
MAFADITGTLTTTLVAAVPGSSIKLLSYAITNDPTLTKPFYFQSAGSNTKLSATHALGAPGAFGRSFGDGIKATTKVGEGLQLV